MVLVLLAMLMDPDLPAGIAIEYIQESRGPRAIQTIKVGPSAMLHMYAFKKIFYNSNTISYLIFERIWPNSSKSIIIHCQV